MIEQTARVVAVERDRAWVRIEPSGSCGTCARGSGCGAVTLVRAFGGGGGRVQVVNRLGARAGETVVVGIRDDVVLRGALMMYGVPLLLLFAAAMAGEVISAGMGDAGELPAVIGAALGLAGGWAWVRYHGRRAHDDEAREPAILRVEPS